MSAVESKVVTEVYLKFIETEKRGWTAVDDYLEMLDFLDDDQLHREADVIHSRHSVGNARCDTDHKKSECFVPTIVEAVGYVLDLYKDTGNMHPKNKYILQCYLALSQAGAIVSD